MYFSGFGDCFLLAFRGEDDEPRYILIDCGIYHQYPGRSERMKSIAQDIAQTTGNKLHIVAVTHEHTDHIYGFMYGKDTFRNIDIDELWLAWTEDPQNATAQELKRLYGKKKVALQTAIKLLEDAGNPHAANLRNVFGFEPGVAKAEAIRGNEDIMEALRSWYNKKPDLLKNYRTPGEPPLEIPGVKGIRCFVLGPPQDITAIKNLEDEKEMYFSALPLTEENAFIAAVLGMSDTAVPGDSRELRGYPFDAAFSVPAEDVEKAFDGFFRKYYGFSREKNQWPHMRRIETDWLEHAADQLALSINDYTNNTSLVLAFELTGTSPGRVLLFVGDAQSGNWLSWMPVAWTENGEGGEKKITGESLIRRTVFYKVGHHGSWNATMREKGLELMESAELVAMIPVDQKWANEEQDWQHPDEKILTRLMQKTRGRVIRSDRIPKGDSFEKPEEARDEEWKAFLKNVEWDKSPEKLWIQYTIR
jgi:hypothetical protein